MSSYLISDLPKPVPAVDSLHRTISTAVPAVGTQELLAEIARRESKSMHSQLPIIWDRAEGHSVFDIAGNKWIDFTSTIFVANIGHSNPALLDALSDVLRNKLLHSYSYATLLKNDYIARLLEFAGKPFEKAFLLSAGTEAVEATIKLMRMQGQCLGKRRLGIICLEGSYHGRTMGAQMATGNSGQRSWIGHMDPDIHHLPFPYPEALGDASGEAFLIASLDTLVTQGIDPDQDICGVLLETFQGWGAIFYPPDYVQAFANFCRDNNTLLAFDEMQAGFARTGRKFGFEHYGVEPDLIACGKGMGSGLPLSGVLGRGEFMDLPQAGDMSSTHSANPLCCAAGLKTIEEIERLDLVGETDRKGRLFFDGLCAIQARHPDRIAHVFGRGLIAALITKGPGDDQPDGEFASRVSERCMQKGVLVVHTGRESIKLGPPLTIPDDALLEGVATVAEAIDEIVEES